MTTRRPRFWYCFSHETKVPVWQGKPAPGWHDIPDYEVHEAMVVRVPKKKNNEPGRMT